MKKMNIVFTIISVGIILGVLIGLTFSVWYVVKHSYFQYGMFRIILFSSRNILNVNIFITFFISCIFIFLYIFKKNKSSYFKLLHIGLISVYLLIILFYINLFLKTFIRYTLFSVIQLFFDRLKQFLGGIIPLSVLIKHIILFFILIMFIGLALFLFKLIKNTNWEKITEIKVIKNIRLVASISLIFIIIINLSTIVDRKIYESKKGLNVILLVVDAWRRDSLGCYNATSINTPNIDNFAKNSVLFRNAIAQSSTTINSAPSMFCSIYPSEHGYFNYKRAISNKLNTIAELLKNEGYRTYGFSSNPQVSLRNNLAQGFDTFIENPDLGDRDDCNEVNIIFRKWLAKNKNNKFFAMLWYMDPHFPYNPPNKYKAKYFPDYNMEEIKFRELKSKVPGSERKQIKKNLNLYNGEVNFFDTKFGKLIDFLENEGAMKNSVIILTSDHGESFGEKKDFKGKPIEGHCSSLYKEQINIPLIIYLPSLKEGRIIEEKVQHIDLVPTVLNLIKLNKRKPRASLRGDSIVPLIKGKSLQRKKILSELIINQENNKYYMLLIFQAIWKAKIL